MTLLDYPRNTHIMPSLLDGIRSLMSGLGEVSALTRLHCARVIFLSNELGKLCHLSSIDLQYLRLAACLHDIGKTAIKPSIISKPSHLDDHERSEMRKHPEIGADMITSLGVDDSGVLSIAVRHHHENFDGSGYPDGLSGENIPHLSRIVSLIDCYDAMSERRSYHQSRTKREVINILQQEQDQGKFDPYLFDKFMQLVNVKKAA